MTLRASLGRRRFVFLEVIFVNLQITLEVLNETNTITCNILEIEITSASLLVGNEEISSSEITENKEEETGII
jgi:hypothetical protein